MAYGCDLGGGQRVYLDNQGSQTLITLASSSPGQQQQASTGFQTGRWNGSPQAFQTASGIVIKIPLADGDRFIQIQGNRIHWVNAGTVETAQPLVMQQVEMPELASMPPMQPMQPMEMQPMKPMTMGNMSMNMNPMEMRMGDMEMRMGSAAAANQTTHQASAQQDSKRFCNQCGSSVKPDDRFCSNCGNRLG